MQLIFQERFAGEALPQGWYTDTAFPKYSRDCWDCRGWDGVVIPLPHDAWKSLRVEVELAEIGPNASAFCGTDTRTALSIDLSNRASARHGAADGSLVIEQSAVVVPIENGTANLTFEWTSQSMSVRVGEGVLIVAPNLRKSAQSGSLHTGFRDCVVKSIAAYGEAESKIPEAPRAISSDYPLEVTVDFNDDLMACAWTHQTFDALFTELKSWGTKTVSWIDLGRKADDYFAFAPLGTGEAGQQTFRNVGDIFDAAVSHAHQHGIELVGILKPYDMAIQGISFPPHSAEAKANGRIERVGTSTAWSTRMAQHNQHLIMARKPSAYGPAKNKVWTRLDLVKDDDALCDISTDDISFIVSEDNETFRPYDGPMKRLHVIEEYPLYQSTPSGPRATGLTRRARVFRFDDLQIEEAFFAIVVSGNTCSFANRLCDLVHLFGENGEETHFTFGLSPRRAALIARFQSSANSVSTEAASAQGGFEYNRYPGSPSSMMGSGGDPIIMPLALDRGASSYIAFARGKDRGPLAAMSPNFPETRALWMTWVEAMLDSGADGIDLRPGHHHADFAWIEYGFEEPVREEMLRQTGVDIWETDDFDYDLWRKIRGEGWTQFLCEASALTRSRGKKFIAHIDGHFDNPPGVGGAMNIVTDWRVWLEEELLDGVTGKALWPGSSYAREVLALAHSKGIPVTYVPYCNNYFEDRAPTNHIGDSPVNCEIPVERHILWGKENGYDGFGFYECASALHAAPDETVNFRPNASPLRAVMQKYFCRADIEN